jgi:GxxExxY protein
VLGCGFLEKVYESALAYELRKSGLDVRQQQLINLHYENVFVGQYAADIMVDDAVLIEIKAIKCFDDVHRTQCLNNLKATGIRICLLLNFGTPKMEVKRVVHNF